MNAFNERLIRRMSVERGATEATVEEDSTLVVSPSCTDTEPVRVMRTLKSHEAVYGLLEDYVSGQRELTVGFIREIHCAFTLHQDTITAPDRFGKPREVPLLKGEYKKWANSPHRLDGLEHQYCPPEQVASEMENLLRYLAEYDSLDPVLVSAWLHHRFTQIHPFQDGNGRVARGLVALLLMKAGLHPIVIDRDMRSAYIDALEKADAGDLSALADLLADQERRLMIEALSLEIAGTCVH